MKINFQKHIVPHVIAVVAFYLITISFFSPAVFDDKALQQHDIKQWKGSSKELRDYRDQTGEEGLWADAMFSGMPAYLVNVSWDDQVLTYIKIIGGLGLPHPIRNIFLAILSFYIMLLVFRVNPYLAMPFAIAYGLSSYMIIGTAAGHNARIGAIGFIPLVFAGIHYALHYRFKLGGLALSSLGISLHLRENHLQITYYILLIGLFYVIFYGIKHFREGNLKEKLPGVGIVLLAGIISLGTFFGKFWTTYEYSKYSIRGKSELRENLQVSQNSDGLSKAYAFEYSNGILEPLTLLIPNFYGGASSENFVADRQSETFNALSRTSDQQMAQNLIPYARAYWGIQKSTAPYYIGAIVFMMGFLGLLLVNKTDRWWLLSVIILGIVLSWGDSFKGFNYFMFDYFPGYDKFRSVTFALVLPIFAIPLLGALAAEKLHQEGLSKENKKKLFIGAAIVGGFCLLVLLLAGIASFTSDREMNLPGWFIDALQSDRKSLMRMDALRSLGFIAGGFFLVFLMARKNLKVQWAGLLLALLTVIDTYGVSARYISEQNYSRERKVAIPQTAASQRVVQDKGEYRVYNIMGNAFNEAETSYYHQSIGGYHGAKMRRYQEFYEYCLEPQTNTMIEGLRSGNSDFTNYSAINMLNAKYLVYGPESNQVIPNSAAYGPAWMATKIIKVESADQELVQTCENVNHATAIVDVSKFPLSINDGSQGSINLIQKKPGTLDYEASLMADGLAVFSEIYYPKGWKVEVNGEAKEMIRANFLLRALPLPAGDHKISFRFEPAAYTIGNPILMVSNWIVALLIAASLFFYTRRKEAQEA